jgi:hypothetical protein
MKTIEETMSIIYLENNHREINTLHETEILKAASSKYLLNNVIAGQNEPMYKLLPSSVIRTPRSTAQTKLQHPTRPAENVVLTAESLQERKHNL